MATGPLQGWHQLVAGGLHQTAKHLRDVCAWRWMLQLRQGTCAPVCVCDRGCSIAHLHYVPWLLNRLSCRVWGRAMMSGGSLPWQASAMTCCASSLTPRMRVLAPQLLGSGWNACRGKDVSEAQHSDYVHPTTAAAHRSKSKQCCAHQRTRCF